MTVLRLRPIQLGDGLYQLQAIGVLISVLVSDGTVTLVDTGARRSLPLVSWGLKRLGLRLEQVSGVILTHTHPDHAGDVAGLVRATGARVAVHQAEAGYVRGDTPALSPFQNRFVNYASRPVMPLFRGGPVESAEALDDGAALDWTQEVRIVHTPGHTPGSISLYLPRHGAVIVGDALQYRFRRLSSPSLSVTQDVQEAEESLARLRQLDFHMILFSHFPPLRDNARGSLDRLVRRNAQKRTRR